MSCLEYQSAIHFKHNPPLTSVRHPQSDSSWRHFLFCHSNPIFSNNTSLVFRSLKDRCGYSTRLFNMPGYQNFVAKSEHILSLGHYCTEFLYFYFFCGQSSGINKTNSMHFRKKWLRSQQQRRFHFSMKTWGYSSFSKAALRSTFWFIYIYYLNRKRSSNSGNIIWKYISI